MSEQAEKAPVGAPVTAKPVDPKVFDKAVTEAEKAGFKAQVVYGNAQPALRTDY